MIHAVLIFNNSGKPRLLRCYPPPSPITIPGAPTSNDANGLGHTETIEPSFFSIYSSSHSKFQLLQAIYQLIAAKSNHHAQSSDQSNLNSSVSASLTNFLKLDRSTVLNLTNHHNKTWFNNFHSDGHQQAGDLSFLLDLNLMLIYRHYATLFFVFLVDQSESHLAILDLIQVFVESLDKCFKNVCELDLIFNFDELNLLLSQIIIGGIVLDTSVESITKNFKLQSKALKASSSILPSDFMNNSRSGNSSSISDGFHNSFGGVNLIGLGSSWKPFRS
ncbi:hypothetical protein O181_036942 [Austropuccinia psidii MF-1]|uniref:AP complex mu/sigma subunit domain-containing protein n=1 Tax=Austropuccinia psidii MF-1 TaxID=1389203 RepID=A0A9Q3D818_9BASI|nr:hypothetical protein [Austropuccinia psidii MF-1]